MNNLHSILMVVVCVFVTMALRFAPFLAFQNRQLPEYVVYLGKVLPYSIMAMLVVYCLKSVEILSAPFGIPELVACAVVVGIHIWKRNTLLSILIGTAVYMLFIQVII